jgi:hypothetical protein
LILGFFFYILSRKSLEGRGFFGHVQKQTQKEKASISAAGQAEREAKEIHNEHIAGRHISLAGLRDFCPLGFFRSKGPIFR